MESTNKRPRIVYTIVERPKDKRKFWIRIGVAFLNRDGSINVQLDAVPVNGQLQIRETHPVDDSRESANGFSEPSTTVPRIRYGNGGLEGQRRAAG